ncbi:MAG: protease SohB [Gammaproteobacteria bacterium]|nr:protease SohB [Gammaproteobacteria bacterium]
MEFWSQYGLFALKALTFLVVFIVMIVVIVASRSRDKGRDGSIEIKHLNARFDDLGDAIKYAVLDKAALKIEQKIEHKKHKAEQKETAKALKLASQAIDKDKTKTESELQSLRKPCVFVLDFDGDIRASAVEALREEISALIAAAEKNDEVVLRLESPGGMVHAYGLASSQLQRIVNHGLHLTICVDKVAASGGYMMACLGHRILAAPFAILGSIGVMAQLPNFNRLLKRYDVDYELFTAGDYKRTVTMFGENTEKGRSKFQQELNETHLLFKQFVLEHRPQLNIEQVATGEIWFGSQAIAQGLIDELMTSDEYIQKRCATAEVYAVSYEIKKSFSDRLSLSLQTAADGLLMKWLERGSSRVDYQ